MMKKITAIIMALTFVVSMGCTFAYAEDGADATTAYDYTQDPLVNLDMPLGEVDYANGNMVNALDFVTDKDGNPVYEMDSEGRYVLDANKKRIQKTETVLDENGQPKVYLGAECYALYQVTTGKVYAVNNGPSEIVKSYSYDSNGNVVMNYKYPALTDDEGNELKDDNGYTLYSNEPERDANGNVVYDGPKVTETTLKLEDGGSGAYEAIPLYAYYVLKCPACGQATGGYSYAEIYGANTENKGCCAQCGTLFPSPSDSSMKFYRFIVVHVDSSYYGSFSEYNFADAAKAVFGDTAKYYGDGTDYPQQYLVYEDTYDESIYNEETGEMGAYVSVLTGFVTSGSTKNNIKATLYILLAKIGVWFEPLTNFLSVSKFIQFKANLKMLRYETIDKILSSFVT